MTEDRSVLERPASPPDEVLRYGPDPEQVADFRAGSAGAAARPLVVVVHGGFWRPEYDRAHTGPQCEALAAAGWSVASVEYRRLPGDPDAAAADLRLALAALPRLAGPHDGRVLALGHSAGGHLALWMAAACPGLHGALALAPVADLRMAEALDLDGGAARAFLGGPAEGRPDLDPVRLPAPPCPVTLLHGEADAVVPPSLSGAYLRTHPGARLRSLPGVGHFAPIDPLSAAWPAVLEELESLAKR